MAKITYIIGTDHAGVRLRDFVKGYLEAKGFEVKVYAPESEAQRVDYPDYAAKVCEELQDCEFKRGILICGSGIGMSIAANRYKHIRAALCQDAYMAKMARAHNDANVLCLGERVSGVGEVESILEAFMSGEFEGGRHAQRLEKLASLKEG